ncbi:MAG: UDP-3-O-(3-hydroxymyristoyl)glucosamine N-acyltransferase [Ignavibacteriales bacterium]|nr:UDP-3-O-(3-hydroxymyristoyl)glucosamine N-acyltransferase [Ignavibacteriales bacterium]
MTTREIATIVRGEISGDEGAEILRVAKIEESGPGDLTFLANPKYLKHVAGTKASAILVSASFDTTQADVPKSLTVIKVPDPYVAFLQVLKLITPIPDPFSKGVHATASVAASAAIGTNVSLGAHASIGEHASIGSGTKIAPCCVIGNGVTIGENCLIYPHVTLYHGCRVGKNVIIQAGTVIGSDGFGFAPKPDGTYEKIPQLGIVVLEDDVEVGANCTIDRATLGQTVLKRGVKLDNMVHIAHNVVVGEDTVIAAQTGISGSTKVGKNVIIAGQVGIVGHIEIADRTVLMAKTGVSKSTEPGVTYWSTPAKEHKRALKIEAVLRSLPELAKDVEDVKKAIEKLQDILAKAKS